ncbi:hypothetical protein H1R20_g5743, partial [Candolleomyces eurysporus]
MFGRLMIFFQDVVICGLLETLRRTQRIIEHNPNPNMMSPVEASISNGPVLQIQIDEVQSDLDDAVRNLVKVQSSYAPHQPPAVYYLSSLVAPLLAAILESIDVTSLGSSHELSIRFYGLLELIASLKIDAYNDLLQIAAYHSPQSRKPACALLATLWPKVIGHATISRNLSVPVTLDFHKATIHWADHRVGHRHSHQFIPWHFIHKSSWSNFQGVPQHSCSFCAIGIDGFGLLCPFCMSAVHFDCYDPPGGTLMQQYTMTHDAGAQRVAMLRISPIIPSRGEPPFRHNRHTFEPVTVFTLCLCYLCHQPLWGCVAQGAKCSTCSFIAHTSCLLSPSMPLCGDFQLDSEHMTIDHKALRRSALSHFPELRWNNEQLGLLSYEEILIIHDNLKTQLRLITNGVALSSIVVMQRGKSAAHAKDFQIEEFELHKTLDTCERLLGSAMSQRSTATLDYMEENRIGPMEHSILYDFSNLVYLSTSMKSPISLAQHPMPSLSTALLNVEGYEETEPAPAMESVAHPYEAVPLSHMREVLNVEFNIRHPAITKILLDHLYNLSFFERIEPRQNIATDPISDDILCVFPLPLGLDMSTDVETLVSSIETCLLDLDLSVNEFGFLLVVRKFWPNGLMSEYGLRRLARSILSWIVVEDDNLAIVLRDYIGKQKPLPGVRSTGDMPPWPFAHLSRSNSDMHSSNGRDYMTVRTALLTRYAVPWLLSLHDQGSEAYTDIVYDTCIELADDRVVGSEVFDGNVAEMEAVSTKRLDAVLVAIIKISHAGVTFSCSEELVLRWLMLVTESGVPSKPIAGLNRLFPRDADLNRLSSINSADSTKPRQNDADAQASSTSPFDVLIQGLSVDSSITAALKGTDTELKSLSLAIIRHTFAACLLIYGCDRNAILGTGLLEEAEIKHLFSRRKMAARAQAVDDPIVVHPGILHGINQYLRLDIPIITCYIAKFFSTFFNNSPLVASYEIDNFVLKNGLLLAECAWRFYGTQRQDIAAIRSQFLLRVIVVDSEPFQNLLLIARLVTVNRLSRILADVTSPAFNIDGRQWRSSIGETFTTYFSVLWNDAQEEIRLSIRVHVNSLLPAQIEAISQCWNEMLTTSPMADKLKLISFLIQLRPHLPGWKLISWDNLIQVMEEYDSGKDIDNSGFYTLTTFNDGEPETIHLLVSGLILALAMVADGVPIDAFTLLKIKLQLVRLIGFSDISVVPSSDSNALLIQYGEALEIPEMAFPCIEGLVSVVDAPHTVDMPASVWGAYQEQEDKTISVLVGHVFIDVVFSLLSTVEELESLPVLPVKSLLEATYTILHKVDFDIQPARSLQPLLREVMGRIIELSPKNVNYEIRQLALIVIQAFCKMCATIIRGGATVFAILENVTEVVVTLNQQSQDALVLQGKALMLSLLTAHSNDGLMINIFKRQLKPTFFTVLKQVLDPGSAKGTTGSPGTGPEGLVILLWRDSLARAPECDPGSMQTVIANLGKFVEVVYYEGYSYEMITYTGQQVSAIMRRLSDSAFDSVDSSTLLTMLARLSKNNRKHARNKIQSSSTPLGKVTSTLIEILTDSLRLKVRVLPSTLNALIESLSSNDIPIYPNDPGARFQLLMFNLFENGCYFLDHHVWVDSQTENDFQVSMSVARIVLQALEMDPTSSTYSALETSYRLVNSLRSWTVLALTALQEEPSRKWVLILYQHFMSFSYTYLAAMRTYAQSNLSSESAASDINQAYVATKLWLMLAQRVSNMTGAGDGPMLRVWNELWPVFESIIDGLEVEARAGLSSTLLVLASTTVADLLLFLRNLRSPLALELTSHMETLNRLKTAKGETDNSKMAKAVRAMSEAPAEISIESILEQTAKELIAIEKMKSLEVKRERFRKDPRMGGF